MEPQPAVAADAEAANKIAQEEEALKNAMRHLKLLHIKCRLLRNTIPQMLEPLVQKHPSPDALFAAFMKAVEEAQIDLTEFKELVTNETSNEVFTWATKSRDEKPLGILPWKHKDWPRWFDLDKDDFQELN